MKDAQDAALLQAELDAVELSNLLDAAGQRHARIARLARLAEEAQDEAGKAILEDLLRDEWASYQKQRQDALLTARRVFDRAERMARASGSWRPSFALQLAKEFSAAHAWRLVPAGAPPDMALLERGAAEPACLAPPGAYDLWVVPYPNGPPLPAARGVRLPQPEPFAVRTGLVLENGPGVPAFGWGGGWQVLDADGAPLHPGLLQGSAIPLAPGRYVLRRAPDGPRAAAPVRIADVTVEDGPVRVRVAGCAAVEPAAWAPPLPWGGWWGLAPAADEAAPPLTAGGASETLVVPPGRYRAVWLQAPDARPRTLATVDVGDAKVTIPLKSGIRVERAAWVPPFPWGGYWGVVRAGAPPRDWLAAQGGDGALLAPGEYDVYWAQSPPHAARPLRLAAGVRVEEGGAAVVRATSGISPRGFASSHGWWVGATAPGAAPDAPLNWADPNVPFVLPPGRYDVWYRGPAGPPRRVAQDVEVAPDALVPIQADGAA